MTRTNSLLTAIAAELRLRLPGLSSCQVHDGKWDESELMRWTVLTPAVRVAWLGAARTETPGEAWTDCSQQLAAYVVTRDQEDLPRGAAARNLVDWLLLYLPRARWGLTGIGPVAGVFDAPHVAVPGERPLISRITPGEAAAGNRRDPRRNAR